MKRRGFLTAMLAAGMAPAIVKAASLMPVRVLDSGLLVVDAAESLAFHAGHSFTVPEGVTSVWVTAFGGGGGGQGGGGGMGKQLSPHEWEDGTVLQKPVPVVPGQRLAITVGKGKSTLVEYIGEPGILTSQLFSP